MLSLFFILKAYVFLQGYDFLLFYLERNTVNDYIKSTYALYHVNKIDGIMYDELNYKETICYATYCILYVRLHNILNLAQYHFDLEKSEKSAK